MGWDWDGIRMGFEMGVGWDGLGVGWDLAYRR